MFVDSATVTVKAGRGGDGLVSFRREKFVAYGGPNGGDGGNGGDVIVVASNNQNTLATYRHNKVLEAKSGENGLTQNKRGKSGEDLIIPLPVGTVITNEAGEVVADLTKDGQRQIIANGGLGGFGNAHFKSSVRQAPKIAEKGTDGETFLAKLELKLIADVGLVGLPNAGKSTFLSVVSKAKPTIADYPFTTLKPNLGVADIDKSSSLLIADIPGLIEGAHKGKGLGFEFLKHVERNKVILHLVDVYGDNPTKDYLKIRAELEKYSKTLAELPEIVALTKTEGLDESFLKPITKSLEPKLKTGSKLFIISSQAKTGLKPLLRALAKQVELANKKVAKQKAKKKASVKVYKLDGAEDDWWQVEIKNRQFVVSGPKIDRFAKKTFFDDSQSINRLLDICKKLGILHELERQGHKPGKKIIFGKPEIGRIIY